MENLIGDFFDSFFNQLIGKQKTQGSILKKHTEHLDRCGEFSMPNSIKSWHGLLDGSIEYKDILSYKKNTLQGIINASKNWCLSIAKIDTQCDRLHLYLERLSTIKQSLIIGTTNCVTLSKKLEINVENVECDSSCLKGNDLSSLRVKYVKKALDNLYEVTIKNTTNSRNIFVTDKSTNKGPQGFHVVLCGCVINAKTGGKETLLLGNDFIQRRQNEMILIAQHKYGVRVTSDFKWKEFLTHLGNSAVIFELLQVKPSNSIKVDVDVSTSGSSKGAAFVLYNCARLESILRSYNDKVKEGYYPPLPPFEEIDFSLLNLEDEWALVFNYVLGFPQMILDCVIITENTIDFRPHHICLFLSSMVRLISQYYRKTRILTESRSHLMPVMYARLYLLRTLNEILKTCLAVIDIKSVSQM